MISKTNTPKKEVENIKVEKNLINNSPESSLDNSDYKNEFLNRSDIFVVKNQIIINGEKRDKTQKTQKFDNRKKSIFDSLIGKPRPSEETSKKYLIEKGTNKKVKKSLTTSKKSEGRKDLFLLALNKTEEDMQKEIEEDRKEKEKEINYIEINDETGLSNQKEAKNIIEKKEIKKDSLPIDLSIPIPHIDPIRKNNLDKYKSFHPTLNDIYQNVLSFNFYKNETKTIEVPNTFENEAHYRYVWITNFFNELKYSLLNEKIDKSEVQNYESADIKMNLMLLKDINGKLIMLKITTNKKLYELKKKILKDNDIIAIFGDKTNYNKDKITLKNEEGLNYFLGIVTKENDPNDLNVYVLKEDYEKFMKNAIQNDDKENFYDKKIKYLGSINSSIREYKSLLYLNLSSFTGIIKTDTIISNHNNEEINPKNYISSNFYLSEKETFLKNLLTSEVFNEPQKKVIFKVDTLKNKDILLIQGPPGTGKTHTIIGLISFLLKKDINSKILVCAPSNAAIDEICSRLALKGVFNSKLEKSECKFLRFGLFDRKDKEKKYLETLNGKILEKYSLEYLSDQKYKKDIETYSEKLENLKRQLNLYNKDKSSNMGYIKNIEAEISMCLKIYMDKKYQKTMYEHDILVSTPILCTTLNNAGNERLRKANLSYEYLIIDEASQSVEPSCLIPLCLDVKKLILVGDHMQLPATVFYINATRILYNRSLFERLIDNKYPRSILTVQYRMQSNISEFISKVFYENKLINDESYSINVNKELFYSLIKIENNFSFFDVSYGEEKFEDFKKSYYNECEIKFCFQLIKMLIASINNEVFNYEVIKIGKKNKNNKIINSKEDKKENNETIVIHDDDEEDEKIKILESYKFAIICPYKSQVIKFKEYKKADKYFSSQKINDIEINTVDSFQGQERDIIIFSTVRSNFKDEIILIDDENISSVEKLGKNGIGFLNDFRRMNVAISRAKIGCFVVGNSEVLNNNFYWKTLINYCKDKNSFFKVDKSKESESIKNIMK